MCFLLRFNCEFLGEYEMFYLCEHLGPDVGRFNLLWRSHAIICVYFSGHHMCSECLAWTMCDKSARLHLAWSFSSISQNSGLVSIKLRLFLYQCLRGRVYQGVSVSVIWIQTGQGSRVSKTDLLLLSSALNSFHLESVYQFINHVLTHYHSCVIVYEFAFLWLGEKKRGILHRVTMNPLMVKHWCKEMLRRIKMSHCVAYFYFLTID